VGKRSQTVNRMLGTLKNGGMFQKRRWYEWPIEQDLGGTGVPIIKKRGQGAGGATV